MTEILIVKLFILLLISLLLLQDFKMNRNIGVNVQSPSGKCEDKKCPFHGSLRCHGNIFTGVVSSTKMHHTASIEWAWRKYLTKYERYEMKRTKVKAHNTPCINAVEGDRVRIMRCRPLSKTKNFVIIEKLGSEKGFKEKMSARESAKIKKVEKEVIESKEESKEIK